VGDHVRVRPVLVPTTAVSLAVALALGAAPAGADETTLGQTGVAVVCSTAVPAGVVLGPEGAGGATYTAPMQGVVTSFSHLANNVAGQVRALVLADSAVAGHQIVVATSARMTVTRSRLNTFPVRLPIVKGQRVGLGFTAPNMACATPGLGGDATLVATAFDPDSTSDFASAGVLAFGGSTAYRPNISAVLEPDADGDGFGDVSQDACPRSALSQAACPDPDTSITKRPRRFRANGKVKIAFTATIAGSRFQCSTDRRKFRTCASPFKKTLGIGTHLIRIRAVSPAGIEDPQPSRVRVTIRR
jgi:hypothetical protein